MKKIILLSLAFLTLAACSKDNGGEKDVRHELRLSNIVEAETDGSSDAPGGMQSAPIAEDGTVWAWVSDAGKSGEASALYNAVELTAGAGGTLSGAMPMYFPETGNAVDVRALHGTFSKPEIVSGAAPFPARIGFTVEGDYGAGGDACAESDLLYAAADNIAPSGNPTTALLTFYHMLSKLELQIEKEPEVEEEIIDIRIDGVALSGTFTPNAGADISLQSERAAMIRAGEKSGTLVLGTAGSSEAIVVPQSVAGKTITVTLSNSFKLSEPVPGGKFESGKRLVCKVKVLKGNTLSVTSSIEPWENAGTDNVEVTNVPPREGDWFYSDGTWSTVLDEDKEVIGVVFQTDPDRIGYAEKDALKANGVEKPHGLVMALKDAENGNVTWCMKGAYDKYGFDQLTDCTTKEQLDEDISGLHNYMTVLDYAGISGALNYFPAFRAVRDYTVKAPARTTGWFLPSAGQWYDFLVNLGGLPDWDETEKETENIYSWHGNESVVDNLNRFFKDGNEFPYTGTYHTSSEENGTFVWHWVLAGYSNTTYIGSIYKSGDSCLVRPVLAF